MKKGFTLIELLAVIVILAVIALIATPIILNIIEDSRKQSIKSSAELYVDGLTKQIATKNLTNEFNPSSCTVSNGNVTCDGTSLSYEINGKKPTSGSITFNNGIVTGYTLNFDDYTVTKDQNGVSIAASVPIEFNGTFVAATQSDTHKGIVYMDPTDLSTTCNAQLADANLTDVETLTQYLHDEWETATASKTMVKSGCMKFYIYDDSGTNYKMILDHNTSGNVAWATEADFVAAGGAQVDWDNWTRIALGPVTANAQLASDTAGWVGNPRLITADEVAHIVGADEALGWDSSLSRNTSAEAYVSEIYLDGGRNNTTNVYCIREQGNYTCVDGWNHQYANSSITSDYAWLYDYTVNCEEYGCNIEDNNYYPTVNDSEYTINIWGYWTSTGAITIGGDKVDAWCVTLAGHLQSDQDYIDVDDWYGVRPVIELPKSVVD